MFDAILNGMLGGWKTHLVTTFPALALLAIVVVEKYVGADIPGFVVPADWIQLVLAGLGFGALRSGIANKV